MSIITKPYELSVWRDVVQDDLTVKEKKIAVISSNLMQSQGKARNIKIVSNINGQVTVTFTMYKKYYDNITGKQIDNPFVSLLTNETKVKLKNDGKWYDLIIKECKENSNKHQYDYTAIDSNVNELSKNGFNLVLTKDLFNNQDSLLNLAETILEETDWEVDRDNSHLNFQTVEESLVKLRIKQKCEISCSQIIDPKDDSLYKDYKNKGIFNAVTKIPFEIGDTIFAFYSCCVDQPRRFQFFYKQNNDPFVTDDDRVIIDKNCQYFIDMEPQNYTSHIDEYSFVVPHWFMNSEELVSGGYGNDLTGIVSTTCRGKRYVFSEKSIYNDLLQTFLYERINETGSDGIVNGTYYVNHQTEYYSPIMVDNIAGNNTFKNTDGWQASVLIHKKQKPNFWDNLWSSLFGKKADAPVISAEGAEVMYNKFVTEPNTLYEKDWQDFPMYLTYHDTDIDYSNSKDITDKESSNGIKSCEKKGVTYYPVLVCAGPKEAQKPNPGDTYMIIAKPNFKYAPNQSKKYSIDRVRRVEWATYESASSPSSYVYGKDEDTECGDPRLDSSRVIIDFTNSQYNSVTWTPLRNDFHGTEDSIYDGYYYTYKTIPQNHPWLKSMTDESFKSLNSQLFIRTKSDTKGKDENISFLDFQMFKVQGNISKMLIGYTGEDAETLYTPLKMQTESTVKTKHIYYTKENVLNAKKTDDFIESAVKYGDEQIHYYRPVYYDNAEKIRSVEVKESNYYNSLMTLAETFQSWLQLNVEHDEQGNILNKKVSFKNYVGKVNYSGFKYGVNLIDIQRNINSKSIVTKMIVKNNNNAAAQNGFCSIADSALSETGENFIIDFAYYINQKLIDEEKLSGILYKTIGARGPDINELQGTNPETLGPSKNGLPSNDILDSLKLEENDLEQGAEFIFENCERNTINAQGYFTRLKWLNNYINTINARLNENYLSYNRVISKVTAAEDGLKAANTSFTEAEARLLSDCSISYTSTSETQDPNGIKSGYSRYNSDGNINPWWLLSTQEERDNEKAEVDKILAADTTKKIITEMGEHTLDKITNESILAEYKPIQINLERRQTSDEKILEAFDILKKRLNQAFQKIYGCYIQEGTWQDEKYASSDEYYTDAQATMYNSAFPQITYTINVAAIGALKGYEYYNYGLGDKSYIEDVEFFGYGPDRVSPYREEVVISEKTEVLDDPEQNTIKIQNYKTQFQDLFQRITASVQQTQYSTGAYQKASALASGSIATKSNFIQEGMSDAHLVLANAGNQNVVQDKNGITISDEFVPTNKLKITGGGIFFQSQDADGTYAWRNAITANGIDAGVINAGIINTNKLNIMSGNSPTFRWDSTGLNAYYYTEENKNPKVGYVDYTKGVRFDKFGLYGYDVETGEFSTKNITHISNQNQNKNQLDEKALNDQDAVQFSLTWDGFYMKHKYDDTQSSIINITAKGDNAFTIIERQKMSGNIISNHTIFELSKNGLSLTGVLNSRDNNGETLFSVDEYGVLTAKDSKVGLWNIKDKFIYPDNKALYLYGGYTREIPEEWKNINMRIPSNVNFGRKQINNVTYTIPLDSLCRIGGLKKEKEAHTLYGIPNLNNTTTTLFKNDNTGVAKFVIDVHLQIQDDQLYYDYVDGTLDTSLGFQNCSLEYSAKKQIGGLAVHDNYLSFPFNYLYDWIPYETTAQSPYLNVDELVEYIYIGTNTNTNRKNDFTVSLKRVFGSGQTNIITECQITPKNLENINLNEINNISIKLKQFPVYKPITYVYCYVKNNTIYSTFEVDAILERNDGTVEYKIEPNDDSVCYIVEYKFLLNFYKDLTGEEELGFGIAEDGSAFFEGVKTNKLIIPYLNTAIYFEKKIDDEVYLESCPSNVIYNYGSNGLQRMNIRNGIISDVSSSSVSHYISQNTKETIYKCSFDTTLLKRLPDSSTWTDSQSKTVTLYLTKGLYGSSYGLLEIEIE